MPMLEIVGQTAQKKMILGRFDEVFRKLRGRVGDAVIYFIF